MRERARSSVCKVPTVFKHCSQHKVERCRRSVFARIPGEVVNASQALFLRMRFITDAPVLPRASLKTKVGELGEFNESGPKPWKKYALSRADCHRLPPRSALRPRIFARC